MFDNPWMQNSKTWPRGKLIIKVGWWIRKFNPCKRKQIPIGKVSEETRIQHWNKIKSFAELPKYDKLCNNVVTLKLLRNDCIRDCQVLVCHFRDCFIKVEKIKKLFLFKFLLLTNVFQTKLVEHCNKKNTKGPFFFLADVPSSTNQQQLELEFRKEKQKVLVRIHQ